MTSRLLCRYATGGSLWLSLAPFRVEQVSLDPYIALVYDVISNRDAAQLREKTRNLLSPQHCPDRGPRAAPPATAWAYEWYVNEASLFTAFTICLIF